MKEQTYSEKLKSPLWQKKRLEIFNRDNWTCTRCGSDKQQLHVHHKEYIKGRQPWEYENRLLETLCERCHKEEHRESEPLPIGLLLKKMKEQREMGFPELLQINEEIETNMKILRQNNDNKEFDYNPVLIKIMELEEKKKLIMGQE